ncbi:MAG: hypothetical protein R3264_23410, partial [Anaerolineae bacterium]|nr:hypothetical protein [Anaerolineae bacterium]
MNRILTVFISLPLLACSILSSSTSQLSSEGTRVLRLADFHTATPSPTPSPTQTPPPTSTPTVTATPTLSPTSLPPVDTPEPPPITPTAILQDPTAPASAPTVAPAVIQSTSVPKVAAVAVQENHIGYGVQLAEAKNMALAVPGGFNWAKHDLNLR